MPGSTNDDEAEAETDAQRIARLEADNASLREMGDWWHQDLVQVMQRLPDLEYRATAAEEMAGKMRERARTLWEAIYKGKIAKPEAILRELEKIIHA